MGVYCGMLSKAVPFINYTFGSEKMSRDLSSNWFEPNYEDLKPEIFGALQAEVDRLGLDMDFGHDKYNVGKLYSLTISIPR